VICIDLNDKYRIVKHDNYNYALELRMDKKPGSEGQADSYRAIAFYPSLSAMCTSLIDRHIEKLSSEQVTDILSLQAVVMRGIKLVHNSLEKLSKHKG
jgi:hypothetical protein